LLALQPEQLLSRQQSKNLPREAQCLVRPASLEGAHRIVAQFLDLAPAGVGCVAFWFGGGAERASAGETPFLEGFGAVGGWLA
jgi:hypothetical protein